MKILHLLLALLLAATTHAQISSVLEDELNESFNEIVSSYSARGVAAAIQFKDGSTWTASLRRVWHTRFKYGLALRSR